MHTPIRAILACTLMLLPVAMGSTAEPPADPPADGAADEKQFQTLADRYWKILRSRPRRDTAFDLWYRHYLDAGKLEELVKAVEQQAQAKPEDFAAQLLLGLVLERRGQDAEALNFYTAAEKLAADNYYPAFLRGTLLARQQRTDEAAAAMAKAIGLDPPRAELLDLYKRLGRLQLQQGKTNEALRTLSQLAEKFSDDRQVLEELAQLLSEERQYDEAIRRWEQLASLAGGDPQQQIQAKLEITQLHLAQGRRKDGVALLDKALDQAKPDSWLERDIRRRIEQAFLQGEDEAGLVAWCEARLRDHPQDLGSLLQLARALAQAGKASESLARYSEAVTLAGSRRDVREAFIEALVSSGKLPEAVAQCQLLAEKHPQDADVLRRLGQLQLAAAKTEDLPAAQQQAIETWKRIAAIRPSEASLALQVAEACRQAAKEYGSKPDKNEAKEGSPSPLLATAEAYYREALRRAPDDPQYHEYLGEFLHAQKRRDQAIEVWSRISSIPTPSAESWHRLAEVYAGFDYLPEAVAAARKSLEHKPNDFDLHDYQLGLELRQKNHDQALAELDQLERLATADAAGEKALKRRVEVYEAAGRIDQEIVRLEKAARDGRAEVKDLWLLGLLQSQRWQHAAAAANLAAALAKSGDNITLLQAYAEALKRGNDASAAVEQYQRLAKLDPRFRFTYYQEIIQLELQRGRSQQAKETADLLVKLSPANLDGYRIRAAVAFRAGDVEQGLRDLRQAVKIAPRDVDVRGQLARALAERGQRDEALEHYWRAFELADSLNGKLSLIAALSDTSLRANKSQELIDKLKRMRLRQEEPKVLSLCLAEALVRLKRPQDAERELVALADSRGDDLDVLRQLASLAERMRSWATAVTYQERVVALDDSRSNLETLARYLSEKGDAAASARIWQQMLEQAKDDTVAAVVVDRQLQEGRIREALALCELRLAKDPQSWRMLLRAGCAALALDDFKVVRQKFEAVLAMPDSGKPQAIAPPLVQQAPTGSMPLVQPGPTARMPIVPPSPTASMPVVQPGQAYVPPSTTGLSGNLAMQQGMQYLTTASGQIVMVTTAGQVLSQGTVPPFAPMLPESQELHAARMAYVRIASMLTFTSRRQAATRPPAPQPTPKPSIASRTVVTSRTAAAPQFPTGFPDDLERAKVDATMALWAVVCGRATESPWLIEQIAANQPAQLRRVALACVATGSAGQPSVGDVLQQLITATPGDPLPHLIRLYPSIVPLSRQAPKVGDNTRSIQALHESFQWISENRPAAKGNLSYYLVTQLVALGDSAGAAEVVGHQLAVAKDFSDLGGLPTFIAQSGDLLLLSKLLAWANALPSDGTLPSVDMHHFRTVLDLGLGNPRLSASKDFETMAALVERYLTLVNPNVGGAAQGSVPQAYAITGTRVPAAVPTTASLNLSTTGLQTSLSAAQQARDRSQRERLLQSLQSVERTISSLKTQGAPANSTPLVNALRQQQLLQGELQKLNLTASLFPAPNKHLDVDRLDVLQRFHAWLKTRDGLPQMLKRLALRATEAPASQRPTFELASIYLVWWSGQKQPAVESLERLSAKYPDDQILRLALAQAYYSQNDLPLSLAELDKLHASTSELAQPMQQLRAEIRRRWSDHIKLRDIKGHTHAVRSLAFSPDGKRLLSGSYDRTLQMWDVGNGKFLKNFAGHTDLIFCVAWSPSGNTIASGSYNEVRLWDVDSSKCFDVLKGHTGAIRALAFSPDGKLLATAGDDNAIRLRNVLLGETIAVFEGHTDRVFGLAFSPDGSVLASAGGDKTARLWGLSSRKLLDTLTGHSAAVSCVAFSPDGLTLATGGEDNHVMLWRLPKGKAYATLQQHIDAVTSVAFSPDGKSLASASADRSIKLWQLDFQSRLPASLIGHGGPVLWVAFSPNGMYLASAGQDEVIKLWDVQASGENRER